MADIIVQGDNGTEAIVGSPTPVDFKVTGALIGPVGPIGPAGPAGAPGDPGVPGVVQSVIAGDNVTVDDTDPANPIVSATGDVASVNGQTGVVVLDQDDVGDGATYKQYSQTDKTKLAGIETAADVTDAANVAAAGAFMKATDDTDDVTVGATNKFATAAEKTKLGHISVTQAVDLDAMESDIANKQPLDADLTALAAAGNSSVLAATTASFLTADETKLDGIEAGADVTDAANVDAAGATMNTDTTLAGNGYFLDEDDMASDSATKVPSQQSVKAYVDTTTNRITGRDNPYLQQWFTALDNEATTPVNVVVIGDSISSLGVLGGENLAFPWKLGTVFNQRLKNINPSDQWVFAKTDGNTPQMTSNAGALGGNTVGTGGWASTLTTGQIATHTSTNDGITVVYTKQSGGGDLEVRGGVGGTLLATISTANATTKSGFIWTSDALAYQSRTIEITSVGNTILDGVYAHRSNRTSGVRLFAAAHGGYTTATFNDAQLALDFIDNNQPDLVILATGTNDDVGNIDSRVRTLVTNVKAVTTNDLLLWIPPLADNGLGSTFTEAEATLLRQIAVDEDLALVDEAMLIGNISTAGLTYDGLHPGIGGSQVITNHIYETIGSDVLGSTIYRQVKPSTQVWQQAVTSIAIGQLFGYGSFGLSGATSSDQNILLEGATIAALLGRAGAGISMGAATGAVDTSLSRVGAKQLSINNSEGTLKGNLAPTINAQTGTTYTLVLTDAGKHITRNNASASTQDLPQNSSVAIPIGTIIPISNIGAGTVTFQAGAGATITGSTTLAQNQHALMVKMSTNGWQMSTIGAGGGSGDVVGPASSTADNFAQFNGTTGKLIKDGGLALDTDGTLAANSDTKVPSQKATKTYVDSADNGRTKVMPVARVISGQTLMTPLIPVSGNAGTPQAIPLGTMILAFNEFDGETLSALGILVSATSLTGSQVMTIVCYDVASDGYPGALRWSQDITVGTSTGVLQATSLSKTMPKGGAYIGILNPSGNAGTCTVRVGTPFKGWQRGVVQMANTNWSQIFDITSLASAPADLSAYQYRGGSTTAVLNMGNYTVGVIIGGVV